LSDNHRSLYNSDGHVSLQKANGISPYVQVAAIWATFEDANEAKSVFDKTVTYFNEQCLNNSCDIIKTADQLKASLEKQTQRLSKAGFIYCIEDCGFITTEETLNDVYNKGVRILIPMWGKTNALGASHEAEGGLTPLGKHILSEAAKMHMILDISHASPESANDIMDIAERYSSPVIASHSNSRRFFDHSRNLYTDQIKRLISLGGIVGHSLCRWHLAEGGKSDIKTVLKNIEVLIEDAGEDNVSFGCDLDGTDLPDGFDGIASLNTLSQELSKRFSPSIADKILYQNALNKFQQFLK
jgi:membrane dipeptidase